MANHKTVYRDKLLVDELTVLCWGEFDSAQTGMLIPHIHADDFEICYIVRGQLNWWVDDTDYLVNRHHFFITRPGEIHGGVNGIFEPAELYWLQMCLPKSAMAVVGLQQQETQSIADELYSIKHRVFPSAHNMVPIFKRLLAEQASPRSHSSIYARALLHEILIEIIRSHDAYDANLTSNAPNYSPSIATALNWIEQHFTQNFTIVEVAQVANMSRSHFQACFLKEVGTTPAEYCVRLRVDRAALLLKTSSSSITEIAYELGFSTSQYFATVFKKYKGETPRQFKARYRTS